MVHPQRNRSSAQFASHQTASTARTILNIVAHEDDDLLFLSPDLLYALQAGHNVRTIFLTAGDAGASADYWEDRESGVKAAYAQMSGVANFWTQTDAGIAGHPIPVFILSAYPSVSLAFMRLPDGNVSGSGFPSTNHMSLQKLWTGRISTIDTIDSSSSYSKETLTSTLANLISSFQPDHIHTQDYVGTYGDGDHSDHHSVAYLVQTAVQQYTAPYCITGYEGYNTSFRPANVTGADLTAKQNAFYAYVQYDNLIWRVPQILTKFWKVSVRFRRIVGLLRARAHWLQKSVARILVRNNTSSCVNTGYAVWLCRQYTVGSGSNGSNQPLVTDASPNADSKQMAQLNIAVQLDESGIHNTPHEVS
jgi:LmbE family N-acetylglucosaminyl deacetylase